VSILHGSRFSSIFFISTFDDRHRIKLYNPVKAI
jgi:hypothetical protein